jgi:hypothetical protein
MPSSRPSAIVSPAVPSIEAALRRHLDFPFTGCPTRRLCVWGLSFFFRGSELQLQHSPSAQYLVAHPFRDEALPHRHLNLPNYLPNQRPPFCHPEQREGSAFLSKLSQPSVFTFITTRATSPEAS